MQQLVRYGLILAGIAGICFGRPLPVAAQATPTAKEDTSRVIHIIQSDKLNVVSKDSVQLNRFIGNAIFRQASTLFYCDSAFINRASNVLDAYGHIHINQADSIHIYGDYLHYEGNIKLATLRDNARLTDNKITITGPELQYDMNARIGTYTRGGKLVNGTSVLTSREGYYYADTKDVYFKQNVLLVDPEYTLTTDTLLYNTDTRMATIVAPTTINDGKTIMYATSGYYYTETGYGNFGNRPTIEDSTATITADNIEMDKRTGLAYATGNMVYRDTAQKMSLLSNYGTVNQAEKTVLATQHPLLILERNTDTLYLTADTLFSAVLRKDTLVNPAPLIKRLQPKDSLDTRQPVQEPDTLTVSRDTLIARMHPPHRDTAFTKALDSAMEKMQPQEKDTAAEAPLLQADSSLARKDSLPPGKAPVSARLPDTAVAHRDTTVPRLPLHKTNRAHKDSLPPGKAPVITKLPAPPDTAATSRNAAVPQLPLHKADSNRAHKDSLPGKAPVITRLPAPPDTAIARKDTAEAAPLQRADTIGTKKDTTEIRYILAYHNVRIFSDSLQGVADSLYYSSKDSIFRFYKKPVLWANETQLSGDTILLFTKNQQADKILLDQNGLIVKEAGRELYDQIKGNQITGYFAGQALDWMHVDGNAESIYYVKDDEGGFISVNRSLSGVINIYFREGQLHTVSFIKDPEGTMWPFRQRPLDQLLLENFHWDIKRRPKSKYELMGTMGTVKLKEEKEQP